MSQNCCLITKNLNNLNRHYFPYDNTSIPKNGIYILFQDKETGHQSDRIVRVGTHTGNNQLQARLSQHFINENKDRSIFRKNIGRAILNERKDTFLEYWDLDLTTKKAKEKYLSLVDLDYQAKVESEVTQYIRNNFSFVVFELEEKDKRLKLESKIVSTVSLCKKCRPSTFWLGNYSTKKKIVKSGLWQVNELYKEQLNRHEINDFADFIKKI